MDPGASASGCGSGSRSGSAPLGTAAELVALPAAQAVPLPDGVSLDLGAGLGIPAMTAHRCLFGGGAELRGESVLVHGGAGAVGHAAIELARWPVRAWRPRSARPRRPSSRARPAPTSSSTTATEDVAAGWARWAPDGIRRIVDVDIAANLETDSAVLGDGGAVSAYAVSGEPVVLSRALMARNAALEFVLVYTMPEQAEARRRRGDRRGPARRRADRAAGHAVPARRDRRRARRGRATARSARC